MDRHIMAMLYFSFFFFFYLTGAEVSKSDCAGGIIIET